PSLEPRRAADGSDSTAGAGRPAACRAAMRLSRACRRACSVVTWRWSCSTVGGGAGRVKLATAQPAAKVATRASERSRRIMGSLPERRSPTIPHSIPDVRPAPESGERVHLSAGEARALAERAMRGAGYDTEEARILADHVLDA